MTPAARTFLLVALVACSRESAHPPAGVWSCHSAKAGNCREWSGPGLAAGIDNLRKLCTTTASATFANGACPTANVTGRCTTADHSDVFYEGYPLRAVDLPAACTPAGGTFSPK